MRVYIAGPMRKMFRYNFPAFDMARDKLLAAGHTVVSPADLDRAMDPPFDPESLPEDHDWAQPPPGFNMCKILVRDIAALKTCEAVALLPGWKYSKGVDLERKAARRENIPCMELHELLPVPATTKPTNPKALLGSNKLPLDLWPTTATAMGCLGMLNGALKYGRTNFRVAGVQASTYVAACKRHLDAWVEGEELDPDDGVPHLSSALSCLAIIVDAMSCGKLNDDRMVNGGHYREFVQQITAHVPRLRELHKDRHPKHYTIQDSEK